MTKGVGVHPRHLRVTRVVMTVWLAQLVGEPARAQEPSAQTAPPDAPEERAPPPDPKLEEAKELFRQGNELRRVGDWQGALERYLRSRALVPSLPNTMNAAICLDQLERGDEALELYEQVLTAFPSAVTDEVRQHLARAMARVRAQVGSIDVSANVEGALVIDGRMRGRLPLLGPVRVLPGPRRVLVMMDGYEPFERTLTVTRGQNVTLAARLQRLRASGRVRVDDPALAGGEVFVDGAAIGHLPWEGTLDLGPHAIWVRKGEQGTAPQTVVVVERQTVRVPVEARQLGAELRVVASPASADILLDGTRVSQGAWRGRLPLGRVVVEVREPGFFGGRAVREVTARSTPEVTLELRADPAHPRWKGAAWSGFYIELLGGPAFGASLGSGAESNCGNGCGPASIAFGGVAAAHAGYELGGGFALDAAIGYVRVSRAVSRSFDSNYRADQPATAEVERKAVRYEFDDTLLISGPFVTVGAAYRQPLGDRLEMFARLGGGALLASSSDAVRGNVRDAAGDSREVDVVLEKEAGNVAHTAALVLAPQLGLQLRIGRWHLGSGLAVLGTLTTGPDLETSETQVRGAGQCTEADPAALACAPGERFVARERAFGPFLLWTPYLSARLDL